MQNRIRQVWYFNSAPAEVWAYLTKPELLEQWLMKTDFKPLVGHKFRFITMSGKIIACQVRELEAARKLVYSWQTPSAGDGSPVESTVTWILTPAEKGTELVLIHDGLKELLDITGHRNGWIELVGHLTRLLKYIQNDSSHA